jgi:hypothetical protein
MATLEQSIPTVYLPIPKGHQFEKTLTLTSTARYNPSVPPPDQEGHPAFIVHDTTLAPQMSESLKRYLQTAPGDNLEPSGVLIRAIASLSHYLHDFTLEHEQTTTTFFLMPLAQYAVLSRR